MAGPVTLKLAGRPADTSRVTVVTTFDWDNLTLPEGTPLRTWFPEAEPTARRLFRCAEWVYAVTNHLVFGGTENDPGVGGFLWAESERTAVRVHENLPASARPAGAPGSPLPPACVLGTDAAFAAIVDHESARGGVDITAGWTIPEGAFTRTRVACVGRAYYFGAIEPRDDDRPMAIRFDLPRASG